VQGVFYRASTRAEAERRGLNGYARNLADGRVEVLIVGAAEAAISLIEWLRVGPPAARVDAVTVDELRLEELGSLPAGFSTR
jgi:acylphosphatase